jgi:hypothetical protein
MAGKDSSALLTIKTAEQLNALNFIIPTYLYSFTL